MKQLLIILSLILSLNSYSQTAKPDTIYYKYNSIAFKPDTINFKLLSNDLGTSIKIIEFSINCVRYTSLSTFKTIANFGKIKLASTGIGTFISTKYTSSPIITSFVYTINDGKCGTSQAKVTICDSAYYYASSNYAWTKSPTYGWGYFTMANGRYIIQYKGFSEFVSEEAYIQAYKNKP